MLRWFSSILIGWKNNQRVVKNEPSVKFTQIFLYRKDWVLSLVWRFPRENKLRTFDENDDRRRDSIKFLGFSVDGFSSLLKVTRFSNSIVRQTCRKCVLTTPLKSNWISRKQNWKLKWFFGSLKLCPSFISHWKSRVYYV